MKLMENYVKHYRQLRNLSQDELGELVGVSKQQISRIENGDRKTPMHRAISLCRALNALPHDLFPELKEVYGSEMLPYLDKISELKKNLSDLESQFMHDFSQPPSTHTALHERKNGEKKTEEQKRAAAERASKHLRGEE